VQVFFVVINNVNPVLHEEQVSGDSQTSQSGTHELEYIPPFVTLKRPTWEPLAQAPDSKRYEPLGHVLQLSAEIHVAQFLLAVQAVQPFPSTKYPSLHREHFVADSQVLQFVLQSMQVLSAVLVK
jgi:hypothetical protein